MSNLVRFEECVMMLEGQQVCPDYSVYVGTVFMGHLSIGDSCEYYYWPKSNLYGCVSGWFLLEVGNKINELNNQLEAKGYYNG